MNFLNVSWFCMIEGYKITFLIQKQFILFQILFIRIFIRFS